MLTRSGTAATASSVLSLRRYAAFLLLLVPAYWAFLALQADGAAMRLLFWTVLGTLLSVQTLRAAFSASEHQGPRPADRAALAAEARAAWLPRVLEILAMAPLLFLTGLPAGLGPLQSGLLVVALMAFTYGAGFVGLMAGRHADRARRARALAWDFAALVGLLALSLAQVVVDLSAGTWRFTTSPQQVATILIPVYWTVIALVGAAVLRGAALNELAPGGGDE